MKKHTHGGDVYRHQNVLDFSTNCNPLGTPESVKEAVRKSADLIFQYPDVQCTELKEAIAVYENIPAENIICGNGAADLIFSLVLTKKPKKALIPVPTFSEYEQALQGIDCDITFFKIEEKRGFAIGEDILPMITNAIDILFLCNPNNPTGFLMEPKFLLEVLEECREHKVFLVLDECFIDFIDKPENYTMKQYLETYNNFFILKAFTKRYAMAGIRLGYGLCNDTTLLDKMTEITQPWNVSVPAQAAGIAALQEEAYVEKAMKLVRKERTFLKEGLGALGLRVYESKANYIFFYGPRNLQLRCLKRNVLIRDCSNFQGLMSGYYRVAVRTRAENEELLATLKKLL